MADYSGYHRCDECGRSGNNYHPIVHLSMCSVPGKIAASERRRENDRKAKELEQEKTVEAWRELDDTALVQEMRVMYRAVAEAEKYLSELDEEFQAGLKAMSERNLLNAFLWSDY